MSKTDPDRNRIPVLDRKTALDFLDGDEELLVDMLELFQDETPRLLSELKHSVSRQDWEAATRHAHTLKGMAGQIGAARMQSSALVLETMLRGEFQQAGVIPAFAQLQDDTAEVLDLIRPDCH